MTIRCSASLILRDCSGSTRTLWGGSIFREHRSRAVCREQTAIHLTHTAGKRKTLWEPSLPPETGKDLADAHVLFYGHNMRSGQRFGELSSTARSRSRGSTRTFTSTRRMDRDAERCTVCTRRTATVMRTRLDISWRQMRMQSGRKEPQSSPYMTVDQYRTADSRSYALHLHGFRSCERTPGRTFCNDSGKINCSAGMCVIE